MPADTRLGIVGGQNPDNDSIANSWSGPTALIPSEFTTVHIAPDSVSRTTSAGALQSVLRVDAAGTDFAASMADVPRDSYLVPPALTRQLGFSKTLQKWEGRVRELGSNTFWAELRPIKGDTHEQDAEIYLDEVDTEDRPLIQEGAVFYWSIGYLNRPSGRVRESRIRFQRLPPLTRQELDSATSAARDLADIEDDGGPV